MRSSWVGATSELAMVRGVRDESLWTQNAQRPTLNSELPTAIGPDEPRIRQAPPFVAEQPLIVAVGFNPRICVEKAIRRVATVHRHRSTPNPMSGRSATGKIGSVRQFSTG